jgi:hypothetical protein
MNKAKMNGIELANQWLDYVEDGVDSGADLAQAILDGDIPADELSVFREAFVERMRQIMDKVIADAKAELAGE